MKDIIIVGAGGFGRDVLHLIQKINNVSKKWNIKGFIDDNCNALQEVKCDYEIIGSIKDWIPSDNEMFALGISTPKTKELVVNLLKSRGAYFATLINPITSIAQYTEIGEGCIVTSGSIGDNVRIGKFIHIAGSMIGQGSVIGDFSTITGFVNVVSAFVGKRVFIGTHAVVLNGRKIGDDAFICAGSIVFNHVKPNVKVFGNPAKKINL